MPRTCTICAHTRRQEIERAILSGQSASAIAALFRVSQDALQRHKKGHLPDKLAKAHEAKEVSDADSLLREMQELRDKLRAGLAAAEREGSGAGVVAFAREYRNTLTDFFAITDKLYERAKEDGEGEAFRIEIIDLANEGRPCPHCGNPVTWKHDSNPA